MRRAAPGGEEPRRRTGRRRLRPPGEHAASTCCPRSAPPALDALRASSRSRGTRARTANRHPPALQPGAVRQRPRPDGRATPTASQLRSVVLDIATVRRPGRGRPSEAGRFLTFEYIGPPTRTTSPRAPEEEDPGVAVHQRRRRLRLPDLGGRRRARAGRVEVHGDLPLGRSHGAEPQARRSAPSGTATCSQTRTARSISETSRSGDLFHEPVYQLVRQQLLAWQLETDPDVAAERVRVVHVLSPENVAYERSYRAPSVAPLGDDISQTWQRLLRRPDRFVKLDPVVFLDPAVTSEEYVDRYRLGARRLTRPWRSSSKLLDRVRALQPRRASFLRSSGMAVPLRASPRALSSSASLSAHSLRDLPRGASWSWSSSSSAACPGPTSSTAMRFCRRPARPRASAASHTASEATSRCRSCPTTGLRESGRASRSSDRSSCPLTPCAVDPAAAPTKAPPVPVRAAMVTMPPTIPPGPNDASVAERAAAPARPTGAAAASPTPVAARIAAPKSSHHRHPRPRPRRDRSFDSTAATSSFDELALCQVRSWRRTGGAALQRIPTVSSSIETSNGAVGDVMRG